MTLLTAPRTKRPWLDSRATRSRNRRPIRRGQIGVLLLFVLPLLILTLALVLNWVFLVMAQRKMTDLADTLARTAVVALLDEEILMDLPANDASDQAQATALTATILADNNAVTPLRLRPQMSDLTVTPGRVLDFTLPVTGAGFDQSPPPGQLFNTLRIEISRELSGNPVEYLVRNFPGVPDAGKLSTASYAALDNRLVGFAPQPTRPSPVAPLAIVDTAWFVDRPTAADDSFNGNGRYELDVELLASDSSGAFNGVLLDFDNMAPVNFAALPGQILNGITPADIAGGVLAPVSATMPLDNVATNVSPGAADTNAIVAAFNLVAASNDTRRIFPIFDLYTPGAPDEARLIGFVGATVLSAANVGAGNERIRVRVEPAFVIHFTAVTDPAAAENPYIHKIRLVR